MAALFSSPKQVPPRLSDEEIEEERRRKLAAQKSGGRAGTVLTGGAGINTPILGSAASLLGGLV